ncbi:hypothetical protein UFOVP784_63 [uncultured Caudovirales phage]|uniref:Uncharacterized protein n=1 Tax=uncultured Caudovirales phage TaxID=2100421 RepID=A0A6J5MDK3_9CAUD|nr:hypothetical protein UFOVP436_63 [uncultured Caudovirales phage]CAB4162564.1 hypothetical protein UFOVP784_63 [uncultured Caudovirales phage]
MSDVGMQPGPQTPPDLSSPYDFAMFTPGIMQSALINSRRYGNTMVRGGFMDIASPGTARQMRRARKYGAIVNGEFIRPGGASSFMGAGGRSSLTRSPILSRRAARAAAAGKTPMVGTARLNNLNPRAINRLHSVSALGGGDIKGAYNPFQVFSGAVNSITGKLSKNEGFRKAMGLADDFDPKKDKAFSGGVLGRIDTLNKLSSIEKTIAIGEARGGAGALTGRDLKRFTRAQAQRANIVNNITQVQSAANPSMNAIQGSRAVRLEAQLARSAARAAPLGAGVHGPVMASDVRAAVRAAGSSTLAAGNAKAATNAAAIAANPSNAVASTMTSGLFSNAITRYYKGTLDVANMSRGQRAVTTRVARSLGGKAGHLQFMDDFGKAGKYAGNFINRGQGGAKMMTMAYQYAKSGGATRVAAKMGAMGATRFAGAAMTPLNVLATGQLMYDIGKGIGKMAVGGINFAKDAMKSMQGTINKPMFGTGFKDNEVAATSRARGVMAIQNSRLNARSLLGSEAGMMAAHFG